MLNTLTIELPINGLPSAAELPANFADEARFLLATKLFEQGRISGEAAVIALTRSLAPCMAIIDEKRGRRIAQSIYGLPVKGTAGLLVEAHRRGLLSHLREKVVRKWRQRREQARPFKWTCSGHALAA
jgi:hypothetical protein